MTDRKSGIIDLVGQSYRISFNFEREKSKENVKV